MFRAWGADVVNMTTCPEVVLAKELGISYAAIAMVTDYDCWKEDTQAVEAQHVMKVIADNVDAVRKLFVEVVKAIGQEQWGNTIQANKVSLFSQTPFEERFDFISLLNCIFCAGNGQKQCDKLVSRGLCGRRCKKVGLPFSSWTARKESSDVSTTSVILVLCSVSEYIMTQFLSC